MSMMNDEPCISTTAPAALRPELTERFLFAMQQAAEEQGGSELEGRLRRLRPAAIGMARQQSWACAMQAAAAPRYSRRSVWSRFSRWSAAAALFILCTSGSLLVMNSSAQATVPAGLACRSLMETRAADEVQWQDGTRALRSCEVLYEDSFILDGEEGSTITVRVPVRTQLLLEEEVI